jgi:uncharacterized membrane protein YedE/YeeE
MVLAGGCVVSTLYRLAGGNVASMIAFTGMIAGSLLYAEVHPWWVPIKAGSVFAQSTMLSDITPAGALLMTALTAVISVAIFSRWLLQGKWNVTAYAEGYLQPWKAAVAIAVLNTAAYILSGWPMSITTGYTKIGAYIENLIAPSHAAGVLLFNQNSLAADLSGSAITGGAGPRVDIVFLTQIPLFIGIVSGAFLTAVILKEFRVYGLPPKRQLASAFVGGMLLGLGARMAAGCNLTFVLGAVPLFAFQGFVFAAAMVLGAYAGTWILRRFVISF